MRQFYDTQLKVKRLKTVSGNRMQYVATATADSSLQPLGKERGEIQEGVFGKAYVAYVDADTPANRGDRVVDPDGINYDVTEVIIRDYGAFPVKELILTRSK